MIRHLVLASMILLICPALGAGQDDPRVQNRLQRKNARPLLLGTPELVGLQQTENLDKVLPQGLSIGRAPLAEPKIVDEDLLHERLLQQYGEDARYYDAPPVYATYRIDDHGPAVAEESRATVPADLRPETNEASDLGTWIGITIALAGGGFFLLTRLRPH